jgi:hypothetical protein
MAQKHYSPQLNRFLVCVLWHEGQRQKKPMTEIADQLLETGLRGTESWKAAETAMGLNEEPAAYATGRKEDHVT